MTECFMNDENPAIIVITMRRSTDGLVVDYPMCEFCLADQEEDELWIEVSRKPVAR